MRNYYGLSLDQIAKCQMCWEFLVAGTLNIQDDGTPVSLFDPSIIHFDIAFAHQDGSKTRFNENRNAIILGADALPGKHNDAHSRLSYMACLAHELSHAARYYLGIKRPYNGNDANIDESETSLYASFTTALDMRYRIDLIGDAKLRIIEWEKLL